MKQWVLAARPVGMPTEADFRLEELADPHIAEGEALVRVRYLSVDPYMRSRMRDAASYAAPVALGGVMTGAGVGEVIASRHERFVVGDFVEGVTGWCTHAVAGPKGYRKIDLSAGSVSANLGVLGAPGLTAYFGLLDVCQPKEGETVVVSGAAGAVGSIVGQIAKIHGCRVVGVAGTDAKVRWLVDSLGFDGAVNYRSAGSLRVAIGALCTRGVDVYFDNVGGPISDAVMPLMNERGRISVCGQISQYNSEDAPQGPRHGWRFITKRLRMEGFLVFDYAARYKEGRAKLATWLAEGRLKYSETVVHGIEAVPGAFIAMMNGANTGKMLVDLGA